MPGGALTNIDIGNYVVLGAGALLVFLARWVFTGVLGRLDKVVDEMQMIREQIGEQKINTALLFQDLGQVKQETKDLRARIDGISEHWRQKFEGLKK